MSKLVQRTYKSKLYPTDPQRDRLLFLWRAYKTTYNAAVEQKLWVTRTGKIPTLIELVEYNNARVAARRAGEPWTHPLGEMPDRLPKDENGKSKAVANISCYDQRKYAQKDYRVACGFDHKMPATLLYQAMYELEKSYRGFFSNIKNWQNGTIPNPPSPPRFKTRRTSISLEFPNHKGVNIVSPYTVYVQGVGNVHTRIRDVPSGLEPYQSKSFIKITCDKTGQWWLHILYKDVPLHIVAPKLETGRYVGVDLGIVYLAVTSDGEYLTNVRPLEKVLDNIRTTDKALDRLRRTYFRRRSIDDTPHNRRQYSRAAWDSIKGRELRLKKNRLLRKAVSTRRVMIDQAIARLVYHYDVIAVEDLNIKGLGRGRLARYVKDVGWGIFYKRLRIKADELDVTVLYVNPRNTSRECSECGYTAKDNRVSQSVFRCGRCEHATNADENAAKNVLSRALEDASLGTQKTSRKRTYKRPKQKSVEPTQDAAR